MTLFSPTLDTALAAPEVHRGGTAPMLRITLLGVVQMSVVAIVLLVAVAVPDAVVRAKWSKANLIVSIAATRCLTSHTP